MRAAKARKLPVTCGVSINHLTLNENDIGPYRTFFRLKPPLRSEEDRTAMVRGLAAGDIDVIVSSHDPQDADVKRHPFAEAADGAIGLETLLAAALRLHHNGEIGLLPLLRAMTINPARLLGLPSGRLEKGAPADLILVDLGQPGWSTRRCCRARSKNSPFDESKMQGRVLLTMVAGKTVYQYAGGGARLTRLAVRKRWLWGTFSPSTACWRCVVGYLLGSIPFGLMLTRPPASATCARSARATSAPPTCCAPATRGWPPPRLLLDVLKGTLAVLLVDDLARASAAPTPSITARSPRPAIQLHRRPRRLPRPHLSRCGCGFLGGKGVATFIGVLIGMHWPAALWFGVVWIGVALATRYSSLAALCATVAASCSTISSPAGRACRSCSSCPR